MLVEATGIAAAEEAVIGAVLNQPELIEIIALEDSDFGSYRHQTIWRAMRNLSADGTAIDVTTICAMLEQAGKLAGLTVGEGRTGREYLGALALNIEHVEHVHDYVEFVKDESVKRQIVIAAGSIVDRLKREVISGMEAADALMASVARISAAGTPDTAKQIGELAREHMHEIGRIAERGDTMTGYPTGVARLDEKIGGWQPGIVSIVAARPGMGKSTVLLATAAACSAAGAGVHVFSMEDPRAWYMNRTFSRGSGVPMSRISTARFEKGDMGEVARAVNKLAKKGRPWLVDDRSGITADDVIRSVRRHRKENGTKVVIVDYLTLLKQSARSRNSSGKHEAITDTLNELADAAKNDGIAYVVGAQLNRGVEQRDDKRPRMSDLRESGSIEERAKCIIGLYRGATYYSEPRKGIDMDPSGQSLMQLNEFKTSVQMLILKNSQGPAPDRVLANFAAPTMRVWTGDFDAS